ncbi:MAG: redoxin domain-containing protein [Gemmataceae bacterium]|nr:redoxin domain-containing protein [Gemmataceae bacterium]
MNRVITCALGLAVALSAAAPAADPPPEKTGIKVGEKAPAFKLKDQSGEEQELAALLKSGPVALVFYRSASW